MLHVVLGELVPKSMAIQRAEQVTLVISKPLSLFYRFAKPLINMFTGLANFILRLFGFYQLEDDALSEDELKMVLKDSHDEGVISQSEAEIIQQAFSFSDKRALDIMIPKNQVHFLSLDLTVEENLRVMQLEKHTRFPLIQGGFNNIVGIVHVKDVFLKSIDDPSNEFFVKIMRPVLFIDPSMKQDKIMRLFKEKRTHIAVVRDPQKNENVGIVALEDILEELVGDIVDEHGN
jgi:CBS domain containing-hemolysin-like protein